jgi:uncharacterized protein
VQRPVCDDQQLAISSREGVEIDYCPQCRGVWLDRGELDKIIDRAGPGGQPMPPTREPEREVRYRDDDQHYKKRKRKSFLDDIFDFD